MTEFLVILGVVFGAAVLWFIYNVFIKNAPLKGKSIAEKAESVLKKDMSSKCARCTFYINNDYDNGYSQSEWFDYYKECTEGLDKDSEEYAEAVAPFINAIVVDEGNYYVRRGMEKMGYDPFSPGHNDRISLKYFVEPYKYVKNEVRRTSSTQTRTTTVSHNSSSDRLTLAEKREIDRAQHNYNYAVRMAADKPDSEIRANEEKRAHAEYMRVLAKYAGKK